MVPSIIPTILCLVLFAISLAYNSLREFSRSRLESVCKQHEKETRLGHILKFDEQATITIQFWMLVSIVGFCLALFQTPFNPVTLTLNGLLLFVIGFLLPRALAFVMAESFIFHTWPLIFALAWLSYPLVKLVDTFDTLLHRMAGRTDPAEGEPSLISEEIRTVIDEGEREGVIETSAGRIIQRLMEIQHEDVTAVMTPRTEMVCIQVDTPIEEVREQLIAAGHSRIPIYRESPDDLVGILYAKDLLQRWGKPDEKQVSLIETVREPLYVPESTGIESLLERMRGEHVHMAVVLDEYGGVVGLVTMEDILEEIVGDIEDEYDKESEEEIRLINPGTVEVDARVHIDDLNEQFEFELPEEDDYETIGGFVFSELGRIPEQGEFMNWRNLKLTILEVDKRRLIKIRIEKDETLPVSA